MPSAKPDKSKLGHYREFIAAKGFQAQTVGLSEIPALNPKLFDFQRDIVAWALRKGRAAIFADCGLGKTPMQLEWAKHVPGPVLILAPLAVAQQTVREGAKFGIPVKYLREGGAFSAAGIGSEGYVSVQEGRQFIGIELKESYFAQATANLRIAHRISNTLEFAEKQEMA